MPKLSIIIPCYNEEKTISAIIDRVKKAPLPINWTREITIVDDKSTDKSREILQSLKDSSLKIIFKDKNEGKGSALKAGFKDATGDYVLIQDADFEYDTNDYYKLIELVDKNPGAVVIGSRNLKDNNVPFSKIYFYGGRLLTKVFNILFFNKLTDITSCYKIFPKTLIPIMVRRPNNDFVFDAVEMTYEIIQYGNVIETPISYRARSKAEGKKLNWRHGLKAFLAMLKIRFNLDGLIRFLRFHSIKKILKPSHRRLAIGIVFNYL